MIRPEEIAFDVAKEQKPSLYLVYSTHDLSFRPFFFYYIGTSQLRSSMDPENTVNFMSDDTYA